jgi:serine/threonine-protein kinase
MRYKNTDKSIDQIGEELGVDYILEGTIRWEHLGEDRSRVRVTPQLVRVSDETHLWADIYQRDITSIFQVQSEIAENVAGALNIELLERARHAIEAKPTENLEAYNAYLRGLEYANTPDYREVTTSRAVEMFERAVGLDPDFALAHAELAQAHARMYHLGYDRTSDRLTQARSAADRALELQPDLPEAHLALGYYHYWGLRDYESALAEFAVAERNLPDNPRTLAAVGFVLRRQGEHEMAVEKLRKAFELSPQDADLAFHIGETLAPMRRYAEAERYLKQSIALSPDQIASYSYLSWTYRMWTGDNQKVRSLLETAPKSYGHRLNWYLQCTFERDYPSALDHLASAPDVGTTTYKAQWWFYPNSLLAGLTYRLMDEAARAQVAFDSARVRLETEAQLSPDDHRVRSALGIAYAGLGRKEDAVREGKLGVELLPVSKDTFLGPRRVEDMALIYTMIGEYDLAFDEIERMLSVPFFMSVGLLELDPKWDPLRDHPRYREILERYGENGS